MLVNNAGAIAVGPFESMTGEDYKSQLKIHFFAPLKAMQLILPYFRQRGEGRIVNISSIGGKIPVPHMIPYCASKFALAGLSEAFATEAAKDNVHVTSVYPGLMRTGSPIQAVFKGDHEREYAWFAVSSSSPGISMSATRAARKIVDALERGERQVVLSWAAKAGALAFANFPEITSRALALVNRFLPESSNQDRYTGRQSSAWLEEQAWAKPFRSILERAQEDFNEVPSSAAEFNPRLG
jgi:short-subunit dehydrogenase